MMKLDQIKPIPGFDSLKWKEERQAEIMRETEGMTREEVREYFRKGSEKFQAEIERIRTQRRAAETQT
jgi:hypothetical protein